MRPLYQCTYSLPVNVQKSRARRAYSRKVGQLEVVGSYRLTKEIG
jgi:hypothetical protein